MALTVTSIANALFKKLQGKSSSSDGRQFFEEPRDARGAVFLSQIVAQSDLIPTTAPGGADQVVTGVLKRWIDLVLTPVPGVTNAFFSDNLKGCIPFNFGDGSYNYGLKDSAGNAIPFGQGDWLVDTDTGTLTFYGAVPANMPPRISFYQYVGTFGAIGSNPPYLQLARQTTVPTTPPAGFDRIYVDATGKPLKVDPTGAIKSLGGGGGGASGKNYLADYYDGTSITGINTFNNSLNYVIPSASNPVDLLGDAINLTGHLFATGQAVFYLAGTAAIGGLVPATIYYAVRINANVFGLALTQTDAIARKLIDLTSQGTGNQTFNSSGTGILLGTGGTVAGLTTTINTSSPLRAPSNLRLSKDAAFRFNSGWSIDLTLDRADVDGGRPMKLAGKLRTSAGYVSNAINTDLQFSLYDVINNSPLALDGLFSQAIPVSTTATGFSFQFNPNLLGYNVRLVISIGTPNTVAQDLDLIDLELSSAAGSVPGVYAAPARLVGTINVTSLGGGLAKGTPAFDKLFAGRSSDYGRMVMQYQSGTGGVAGTGDAIYTLPAPNGQQWQFDPARTIFNTEASSSGTFNARNAWVAGLLCDATNEGTVYIVPYDATRFRFGLVWSGPNQGRGYHGALFTYAGTLQFSVDVLLPILGFDAGPTYSTSEIALKNTPTTFTSNTVTGTTSGNYMALTGNSTVLQPGTYDLSGTLAADNNGTNPQYGLIGSGWYAANGANSATQPALLSTLPGVTVYGQSAANTVNSTTISTSFWITPVMPLTVKVTQPTTIYLVPYIIGSAVANAKITVIGVANKRPDYSAFGVYGQVDIRSVTTPATNVRSVWGAYTNNALPLPVGTWKVTVTPFFGNGAGYTNCAWGLHAANGVNGAQPALYSTLPNVVVLKPAPGAWAGGVNTTNNFGGAPFEVIFRVTSGIATVYGVAFAQGGNDAANSVTITTTAERLQ